MTPIKSIRAKCLDCSGGSFSGVRECPVENCPLYPYRLGKRPKAVNSTAEDEEEKNPQA